MSLASPARNVVAVLNRATGMVFGKANNAAEAVKEVPQAIGQRISDALPGSSHKLSSSPAGEATASKANSTREGRSDAGGSQATSKAGTAPAVRTSPRAEAQKKEAETVFANIVRPSRASKTRMPGVPSIVPCLSAHPCHALVPVNCLLRSLITTAVPPTCCCLIVDDTAFMRGSPWLHAM